jgi:UPF0288 family protein (methanogenesis marker protein 3)
MCSLDGLHEQVAVTIDFPNGRISTVSQRTSAADAQPRHIVGVLTEGALLSDLALEGAELVVDYLPYYIVVLHVIIYLPTYKYHSSTV